MLHTICKPHFYHSTQATCPLGMKQAEMHYKQLSLVQDIPTTWNRCIIRINRFLLTVNHCATVLKLRKCDLMPLASQHSTMVDLSVMVSLDGQAIGVQKW